MKKEYELPSVRKITASNDIICQSTVAHDSSVGDNETGAPQG